LVNRSVTVHLLYQDTFGDQGRQQDEHAGSRLVWQAPPPVSSGNRSGQIQRQLDGRD
jgi:hypothetical protein